MKGCLLKLGLQVNQEEQAIPSLSFLHLSSHEPTDTAELLSSLHDIIITEDGEEYIKGENDTFRFEKPSAWSMNSLADTITSILPSSTSQHETEEDMSSSDTLFDYNKVIKRVIAHETSLPSNKETPYFNHQAFFANLKYHGLRMPDCNGDFGKYILYGEVVTSTNTILEK